jgi:hypothetical protein
MDTAMMMGTENPLGYNMRLVGEGFRKASGKPVYRYLHSRPRKRFLGAANQLPGQAGGVVTDAGVGPRILFTVLAVALTPDQPDPRPSVRG